MLSGKEYYFEYPNGDKMFTVIVLFKVLNYNGKIKRGDNMAQTLINFRIDESTKKQMEQICNELGITLSTAFNIFAKKVIREKRIPFDLYIDPLYSKSNMTAIDESIKQLDEGKWYFIPNLLNNNKEENVIV